MMWRMPGSEIEAQLLARVSYLGERRSILLCYAALDLVPGAGRMLSLAGRQAPGTDSGRDRVSNTVRTGPPIQEWKRT
jgi:hypothetical protein